MSLRNRSTAARIRRIELHLANLSDPEYLAEMVGQMCAEARGRLALLRRREYGAADRRADTLVSAVDERPRTCGNGRLARPEDARGTELAWQIVD